MKCAVSDFDRTFYVDSRVSPRNLEAVRAWQAAGNWFVIATGRNEASLRELLDDAGSETALCAAASLYSKEVEHSEENQQLLLKLFRRKTLTWQYLVSVLDA